MPVPILEAADFLRAFQALLPRGPAWPREPDAVITRALATLMPSYERQAGRAVNLRADLFPPATDMMLADWEASLGLPDPCAGPASSVAARRAQVVARLVSRGGNRQSVAAIEAQLALLGFTVSIRVDTAPFRMGYSTMGDQLGGPEWYYVWTVVAPLQSITCFTMGASTMGQPLRSWGNAVLECVATEVAPAHTIVRFTYVSTGPLGSLALLAGGFL
jgi:uncharacterized protein YmfQ (DUF2313 family)